MSPRKAIVSTLVLASLAAAAFFAFARSGPRAAARKVEGSPATESEASVATADDDEVRRLRAEIKAKDGVIRALTSKAIASDAERAAAAAATVEELRRTTISRAVEALDARIAAVPANAAAKAEIERALRPTLESKALGDARVDDVRCGGNLCKIALSAANESEVGPAVEAIADHVGKAFGAVNVFPGVEGERAIFVGRSSEDLKVNEAPSAMNR